MSWSLNFRWVKIVNKKLFSITAVGVLAFNSLAVAAPLFLTQHALAATPTNVVINEISSFTSGDWVELYNPTANTIDLSGWSMTDQNGHDHTPNITTVKPTKFSSTSITSHGYITADFGGKLNKTGDTVYLYNAAAPTTSTTPIDEVTYGTATIPAPTSLSETASRTYDGASTWVLQAPTEDADNLDPTTTLPDVYVASDGSGTDCTDVYPCATFANAMNRVSIGGTIHVAAGTYTESVNVNKSVTIDGAPGATLDVANVTGTNGFNVTANNVTIEGLDIKGPATSSYLTYAWGSVVTRGIFINNGVTNFTITNNSIENLRNDILIDGRTTGSVTGNVIDNSKSGISVQYTDGTAYDQSSPSTAQVINITGNTQGTFGNEWGVNYHLNGHWNGVAGDQNHPVANGAPYGAGSPIAATAPASVQQAMLANSAANGGWTVQDQGYTSSNRTAVTVDTAGSDANQGSPLSSLATIQAGVNDVVAGGVVNVNNGTYSGAINITKDGVHVLGASEAGVTVNQNAATPFGQGVTVTASNNVVISNMTFSTPSGAPISYALHAYQGSNLKLSNLTFNGNGSVNPKAIGGVDINSVDGVTTDNVNANHYTKNGFSFTAQNLASDPVTKNVALSNLTSSSNAWDGVAFYNLSGGGNGADINGVTFSGSNSITNNSQGGVFFEGDTDTNFGANATPRYNVTGPSGATVDLSSASFNGNAKDVVNYQTAPVNAIGTMFGGKTGDQMTATEHQTENNLIFDQLDSSDLGLVKYYTSTVSLPAPTNLKPADGSYTNNNQFDDSWSAVTGAVKYEYHWSDTSSVDGNGALSGTIGWDDNSTYDQTTDPGTVIRHNGPTTDGVYYWQVRAIDSEGNPGTWSVVNKVTVDTTAPTGLANSSPSDGTITNTANLNSISWTTASDPDGPVSYYYESSNSSATNADGSFTNPVYQSSALSSTSIPTSGTPAGTYYWHVRAVDSLGNSTSWTGPWKVIVDDTAPVVTVTPVAGSLLHGTETFDITVTDQNLKSNNVVWVYLYDSTGTQKSFGANVNLSSGHGTLTVDTTQLDDGNAWLDVGQLYDAAGNPSGAGDTYFKDYVIDNTAPTVTVDNLSTPDPTPQLTGSVNDPTATITVNVNGHTYPATISGSMWTADVTHGLGDGVYDVQATATDTASNAGHDSTTNELTVDAHVPGKPTVLSPANNSYTNSNKTLFSWTSSLFPLFFQVNTPLTYNLEVATDSGFSNIVINQSGSQSNLPWVPASYSHHLKDGTYYVRVLDTDSLGESSAWSTVHSFTVDHHKPHVKINSPSDGAAIKGTVTVSGRVHDKNLSFYKWTITGPNGYHYTVFNSSSFDWDSTTAGGDGTYTIQLTGYDRAHNSNTKTISITVDNTAPTVTVDSLLTNSSTPTLTGTVNDPTATINVTVDGHTYAATNNGSTWTANVTNPIADGTYDIQVVATDLVGNVGNDGTTNELTVDTTAPVLAINHVHHNKNGTYTITGTTSDSSSDVTVALDGTTLATITPDGSGNWSVTTGVLAKGSHHVTANSHDAAGNVATEQSSNFTVPTTVTPQNTNTGSGSTSNSGNDFTGPQVLGLSTDVPNTNSSNGHVKGSSTHHSTNNSNKPSKNTSAAKGCTKWGGICWYWWIVIVGVVAALAYGYVRVADEDKKTSSGK